MGNICLKKSMTGTEGRSDDDRKLKEPTTEKRSNTTSQHTTKEDTSIHRNGQIAESNPPSESQPERNNEDKTSSTSTTQDRAKYNTEKSTAESSPSPKSPQAGNQKEKSTSTTPDITQPNFGTRNKTRTEDTSKLPPTGDTRTPTPTGDTGTPTMKGDTITPPPTGDTRTPPTTGDTITPPQKGDTITPPTTGDTRTPPTTGDTITPPQKGDKRTPPTTGDTITLPPTGDTETSTPTGDTETPTMTGDTETPTLTGDTETGTTKGDTITPPPTGGTRTPTPTADTRTPSPTADTRTPPPTGDTKTPSPTADTRTPPPTGGTRTPPPTGDTRIPSPTADTRTPSPTADTRTPPPTGGTIAPSPTADTRTIPPTGDTRTPPPTGDTRTPPPTGDTRTPPPTGGTRTPPPTGDTRTPSPTADTRTPSPTADTRTPPPTGGTIAPSPTADTRTIPPTGDTRTPPPTGDTRTPSPTADTRTPSPTADTRTIPPTGDTRTPPPTGDTRTPPPTGDTRTPPPLTGDTRTPPPLTGGTNTPSPTADTRTPTANTRTPTADTRITPPTGDTRTPPPTGDTRTPPPTGDTRTPPPLTGDTRTPPPTGGTNTPSPTADTRTPTANTRTPPPTADTRTTPPTADTRTTPPTGDTRKPTLIGEGKEDVVTSTLTSQDRVQDDVDQTRVIDSTSPASEEIEDGKSVPTPALQNEIIPSAEPEPITKMRAVIFSLENNNDIKSLERWTRCFIDDCKLLHPSTISGDWKTGVENSSIVIFYCSSFSSGRFIEEMTPYLEHSIFKKGHEGVTVVLGGIEASEDQVRSEWDGSRYSQCERHVFTRTDLQWILQDRWVQDLAEKIKRIRDLLPRDSQMMMSAHKKKTKQRIRNGVTFFIPESAQRGSHWLEPMLRTDDTVDFIVTKISEIKKLLSKVAKTCPACCVLHFTKGTFRKITMMRNAEPPEIDAKMLHYVEEKRLRVIVVVDLDDETSEEELRAQYNKSRLSQSAPLFLFRREESLSSYTEAEMKTQDKWTKLQESIERRVKVPGSSGTCAPPSDTTQKTETSVIRILGTVGIFSRSSNTDYSWMETLLKSLDLLPYVSDVRPFYISNNQTVELFQELRLCKFGILYHTKNRGRVNVTDVTDSLYDEELEAMSIMLGRDNVLVVIDDLPDSSGMEKIRILETQPSIHKYAYNLLLVTEEDKKDKTLIMKNLWEALMS